MAGHRRRRDASVVPGEAPDRRGGLVAEAVPTVFVVDDDLAVREAVSLLIESAGWHPEAFASGPEFLARPRLPAPGCLVLDVVLPALDGCELQRLVADRADLPVIFLSGHGDVPLAVRAMRAGAVDFLTKPFVADRLLDAIRSAIGRSSAARGDAEHLRTLRERHASLSRREREVMALVVAGRLNKQVGGELGISLITVKAHRGRVMRKMQAGSLPDLVNMAARLRAG
jgi:FixJ family two-component response regulator